MGWVKYKDCTMQGTIGEMQQMENAGNHLHIYDVRKCKKWK